MKSGELRIVDLQTAVYWTSTHDTLRYIGVSDAQVAASVMAARNESVRLATNQAHSASDLFIEIILYLHILFGRCYVSSGRRAGISVHE